MAPNESTVRYTTTSPQTIKTAQLNRDAAIQSQTPANNLSGTRSSGSRRKGPFGRKSKNDKVDRVLARSAVLSW